MFGPTLLEIKELAEAYGWTDAGPQKNKWMTSFTKEISGKDIKARINVYFTTMTVTVQWSGYPCRTYREVKTIEKLENILMKE